MLNLTKLRLSQFADIITGATPKAEQEDSWGKEIPFITPSDQSDSIREATPTRFLSDIGVSRLQKRLVPPRSTNLTCIGSTIGKVSLAAASSVTNQQINSLVAKQGVSDADFLYYLIKNWSSELKQFAAGSATPIVNKTVLGNFEFGIPHLKEQRAIAEVLGALDDKIAANTKLSRTIDQFLATYYSRITKNSPTVPLSEIASVNPQTCKPLIGGSLRYIDISSVGQGSYEFPEISSWDDAPSRARRQVRSGDTLWSTVRPNRRSHALNLSSDELLVGSTGLAVLRPCGIGYSYLYESTKTPEFSAYLENVAEGSAYPAVRANRFEDAPINWPESAARDSFEMTADPLRKMQHSNEVENQYLAALRDTLLPQLMSGKLRTKDAEALVESVV